MPESPRATPPCQTCYPVAVYISADFILFISLSLLGFAAIKVLGNALPDEYEGPAMAAVALICLLAAFLF